MPTDEYISLFVCPPPLQSQGSGSDGWGAHTHTSKPCSFPHLYFILAAGRSKTRERIGRAGRGRGESGYLSAARTAPRLKFARVMQKAILSLPAASSPANDDDLFELRT